MTDFTVPSNIRLPDDTSNTGKRNRTQTRVVEGVTVHEHFVVPTRSYYRSGRYCYQSTGNTVQASSGSTSFVLAMTTTATYRAIIRSIDVAWGQQGESVVCETAPLVVVEKATYGTAISATTLAPALSFQSSSTTAQVLPYVGSSGASAGTAKPFAGFIVPSLNSTAGTFGGYATIYKGIDQYEQGSGLELKAGDLLRVFQADAGTASDVRKYTVRVEWDEYEYATT
jgi:hypothetical protein